MQETNKSPLERFLGLFAEVRSGEGVTAVLMTLNIFIILTAYLIAKVVREPLILAGGGAEIKSYSAAGQAILLLGAVPLYSKLAGSLPRKRLINVVTLFFAACLVSFYLLAKAQTPIGVVFFLWVGIFSLMIIAQFWSYANDIYTPEEGKRLFAIVAFGASSGAVFGSFIAGRLIEPIGIYELLLISAGLLIVSLLITNYVDRRQGNRTVSAAPEEEPPKAEEPIGKEGAFKLVLRNRYLLLIALLLLFLNWVNTTGEYILSRTVTETAQRLASGNPPGFEEAYIGKFYAGFLTVVNFTGMIIQLFLVSRILKYLGLRIAILVLPVIALGGYLILAFYPILNIVRWAKTAENATDYSLQNTVRHVLFLPTTREQKYKAKQAIDSFFVRSGDVLSAGLVFVGVNWLLFETKHFAIFNLVLVGVWLFLAVRIGVENRKLLAQSEVESEAAIKES